MELLKFPSVYREAKYHEEQDAVEYAGEKWVVGEKALKHKRGCYYIRDVKELVETYPIFLLEVKRRFGGKTASLSLPLDVYVTEKRKKEKGNSSNLIDKLISVSLDAGFDVSVFPQGIAGLQHLLEKGEVGLSSTLLIDGGFNTVNIAVVNEELGVDYYKTFTDEIGVRNLIEDFFAEELRLKYPSVSTNLVVLKEIFLKGVVDTGLKVEDVRVEKERALSRFLSKFFNKVLGELKRAGIDYNQIVFIGGISYYLSEGDFETNKRLFIPKEGGEFLNVLGLLDYNERADFALDLGFGDAKVAVRNSNGK